VRPEEEWIQIEIPAIISTDVKLNAEIARDKNRTYSKRNRKNNYLLSGLLKCPACHCSMVGQANGRSGKYLYYACTSRTTSNRVNAGGMNRCDNKKYVPANELDEEVWNTLLDYARGNKDIEEILTGRAHGDKQSRAAEIGDIDNEIEAIKKQRETIRAAYRNHESTDAEYRQDMSITMKRLELLQARVAELRRSEIMVQRAAPAINPEDILNAKTFGEKRELLLRWGFIFLAERKENVSELSIMFKEDYDVLRGYKPAARWHYS
jgi:site-specific DNA recombinase